MKTPRPFARVVPLTMAPDAGRYAVESKGARWGIYDTEAEAQAKADELNRITAL